MAYTNLEKYALKVVKDFRSNGNMDNYHFSEVALILEELVSQLNTKVSIGKKQGGWQPMHIGGNPIPPKAE